GSGTTGVTEGPLSTKETLSRPFELSLAGSPFRNCSVVDAEVAVNVLVNICHESVLVHAVQLFVNAPNDDPLADTFTVLVTPKPVEGLSTLPTQNVSV